ncbi:MAG: hypothetical protein HY812_19195 [Planctomycetes bacterium]|nr:hypothetical protein [Planctomycetota bacterium]
MQSRFRSVSLFLVLLAALAAAVAAGELLASVPTIRGKGKVKKELEFQVHFLAVATGQPVYSVPAGKTLVITDVVVANDSAATAGLFRIDDGSSDPLHPHVRVPAGGTTHLAYMTGLAVPEGTQVYAANHGSTILHVRLAGYLM